MTERRHARADLILSAVLCLLAVVYAVEAFGLPQTSPNQADIGPRAYPLLILALLILATVVLAAKALWRIVIGSRPATTVTATDRRGTLNQLIGLGLNVVVTVVYLELLIPLGFILATAIFVAVEVAMIGGWHRYGGRRALIPIAFGCLYGIVIYVLFADLLGVLLPRGIFSL